MSYGFISAPNSIYAKIKKVRPGHLLIFENNHVTEECYWSVDASNVFDGDFADAVTECRRLFNDAVHMRMVSDVPLGAFLSGGVDSSAVVAFMVRNSTRPIKTFSVGFHEKAYDETPFARLVAKQLGTDHTELIVTPDYASIIEKVLTNFDEPFADSSALPCYVLSEFTRRHVTVALSGDGGDEIFGGYDSYQTMLRQQKMVSRVPRLMRAIAPSVAKLFPSTSRLARWSRAAGLGDDDRFIWSTSIFTPLEKLRLYRETALGNLNGSDYARQQKLQYLDDACRHDYLTRLQFCDFMHYLPDDILAKVDRTSMLVSLESRAPFLDHRLVEFAFSLPACWKATRHQKKFLLKEMLRGILPSQILDREKMGFGVPVAPWFRGPFYKFCRDRILSGPVCGVFKEEVISRYLKEHLGGRCDHSNKLWSLLTLSVWMEHNRINLG